MTAALKGITLTHPWAWCIAHAGKRVENRTWAPERQGGRVGMYLAIHGGAMPVGTKRREAEADLDHVRQHILDIDQRAAATWDAVAIPGIVAIARLEAVTQDSSSIWAAQGQYHWILADVLTLPEPLAHRGAQGLWAVEPTVHQKLRDAYRAARQVPATLESR